MSSSSFVYQPHSVSNSNHNKQSQNISSSRTNNDSIKYPKAVDVVSNNAVPEDDVRLLRQRIQVMDLQKQQIRQELDAARQSSSSRILQPKPDKSDANVLHQSRESIARIRTERSILHEKFVAEMEEDKKLLQKLYALQKETSGKTSNLSSQREEEIVRHFKEQYDAAVDHFVSTIRRLEEDNSHLQQTVENLQTLQLGKAQAGQPYFGLDVAPTPHGETGVRVVQSVGPAMHAGVENEDRILALRWREDISDHHRFIECLSRIRPGDVVTLEMQRGSDHKFDANVRVGGRPVPQQGAQEILLSDTPLAMLPSSQAYKESPVISQRYLSPASFHMRSNDESNKSTPPPGYRHGNNTIRHSFDGNLNYISPRVSRGLDGWTTSPGFNTGGHLASASGRASSGPVSNVGSRPTTPREMFRFRSREPSPRLYSK